MSARAPAKKRNRSASSMRERVNRRRGTREDPIVLDDSDDDDSSNLIVPAPAPAPAPAPDPIPAYDPPAYDPGSPPYAPSTPAGSRGILILGKGVGSGAFGAVVNSIYYEPNTPESRVVDYDGEPLQPRKHYAVKIQDVNDTEYEVDMIKLIGESPYILKLYGVGNLPNRTDVSVMVTEMYKQTLDDRIKKENIDTKRRNLSWLTMQMFEAVAFLASKNIVHRDLHSGNIMFGDDPYSDPKIIDFGWSAETNGASFNPFPGMTSKEPYRTFHPPEQRVFRGGRYQYGMCTTKFDVYSMAMNLIELIYDPSKNSAFLPRDFRLLMIATLFGLSVSQAEWYAYRGFMGIDIKDKRQRRAGRAPIYPDARRMVECVILVSDSMSNACTYFVEDGGICRLYIRMPIATGEILAKCLRVEAERPTAAQVVQTLQGGSLSSDDVSPNAFLKLRF